ncbi:MAG: PTS sugar transporter subunit IIA, partial [Spirochaetes bacterium]|nr:PTS sugar transporter subunit IIA [Spirochaetota bacterium]
REKLSSTGIGEGVAIPHALMEGVAATTMAVARLAEPVDFDAEDGGPVDLVFMIAGPRSDTGGHLKLLSKLARTLHDPEFRKAAREAPDGPALARLIYDRD